jgi:hypothetical protein
LAPAKQLAKQNSPPAVTPTAKAAGGRRRRSDTAVERSFVGVVDVSNAHPILVGDVDMEAKGARMPHVVHTVADLPLSLLNTQHHRSSGVLNEDDNTMCLSPAAFGVLVTFAALVVVAAVATSAHMCFCRQSLKHL